MLSDPIMDASAHDYELEERAARLPHCWNCGEPITEGTHIKMRYGAVLLDFWLCDECISDFREDAEDDYS